MSIHRWVSKLQLGTILIPVHCGSGEIVKAHMGWGKKNDC